MISLQQATDARLAALQQQLAARAAQVSQLQEQLQEAQRSITSRDAEVSRLGARLGAGGLDVESLARDQRDSAYDTVILSLNKQVRF